jgi:hypothetical protein
MHMFGMRGHVSKKKLNRRVLHPGWACMIGPQSKPAPICCTRRVSGDEKLVTSLKLGLTMGPDDPA